MESSCYIVKGVYLICGNCQQLYSLNVLPWDPLTSLGHLQCVGVGCSEWVL